MVVCDPPDANEHKTQYIAEKFWRHRQQTVFQSRGNILVLPRPGSLVSNFLRAKSHSVRDTVFGCSISKFAMMDPPLIRTRYDCVRVPLSAEFFLPPEQSARLWRPNRRPKASLLRYMRDTFYFALLKQDSTMSSASWDQESKRNLGGFRTHPRCAKRSSTVFIMAAHPGLREF